MCVLTWLLPMVRRSVVQLPVPRLEQVMVKLVTVLLKVSLSLRQVVSVTWLFDSVRVPVSAYVYTCLHRRRCVGLTPLMLVDVP